MTTTASTYSGPPVTVESLQWAKSQLDALGPPPPNEVRLHPADIAELNMAHGTMLMVSMNPLRGVRIISDPEAPRLPRK